MFQEIKYSLLNEKVYYKTLNNGLKVYVLTAQSSVSYDANLIVRFGAYHLRYNDLDARPGTAHFLEHLMFKMPNEDALSAFSKLGADANAATSYSSTVYTFETVTNFYDSLTLLFTMLDSATFNKKDVKKERDIIVEEVSMHMADIVDEAENIISKNTYFKHPFKEDIGGTIDDIRKIKFKTLHEIYKKVYNNSNRVLVLGGNIDLIELNIFLDKYDQGTSFSKTAFPIEYNEPIDVVKKYDEIHRDVDMDIVLLRVKLDPRSRSVKDELVTNIVLSMLLGKTSDNYEMLLTNKLIGNSFSYYENIECNAYEITIENSINNSDLFLEIIKKILFKTEDSYFTNEHFLRYKKAFLGRFIFSINAIKPMVRLFSEYIVNDIVLFDIIDIVNAINIEDCLKTYNEIRNSPSTVLKIISTNK